MPKRKASFSNQDSNDTYGTKRQARGTSSQPTSSQSTKRSSLSGQPLLKLSTTPLEGDEDIVSSTSTSPFLTPTTTNDVRQPPTLQQQSAQGVGISRNIAARAFSPNPTTDRFADPSSAYSALSAPYPGYTFAASGILPSNSANNAGAEGSAPQMTYQTYQTLLRNLGHVKGTPGPARNTPGHVNLPGNNLGPRFDRKTDFRMDQAEWSVDNLPDILYVFESPDDYYHANMLREPPLKPYTVHGVTVRDIPILPDRISPDPEGWLYECWCRFDPRINYKRDIEPRICPDQRPDYPTRFSQSRLRFRQDCHLLAWAVKGKHYDKDRNTIINVATNNDVDVMATNSTRGLTWGLADPTKGKDSRRIPIPDPIRPKNTRDTGPPMRGVLSASESNRIIHKGVAAPRAPEHHPVARTAAPKVRPRYKASVQQPARVTLGKEMSDTDAQAQKSATSVRETPPVIVEVREPGLLHCDSNMDFLNKDKFADPTSQQVKSTPVRPTEYNFEQKAKILHQAANEAVMNHVGLPSQATTITTNKLVEDFYQRDNIQLLDTTGNEWESTRLDYIEFYGRVDYNPIHFHEYFPRLMEAVKGYIWTMLKRSSKTSRKTSWPDSRMPEERELYEKVWNFERRRWNWYARFGSGIERF
ncbi:hypothetical protein EPUS_06554 [Endocarpon pusillum Z07020]|uniref:Uncharacterized protein n=1 Tax=Endocarpon pusillum (strain Z07020 / HMAS-L-300199) TaxID=1263415 RepID=U1GLI9_ENDPU|nr:uncharacterized protein EPUS_06554 [Endocarpon pusillum Z07020]ERF73093.1 hypothetical protein EPUS_06554 [Endocarpon pusillum Z07020]